MKYFARLVRGNEKTNIPLNVSQNEKDVLISLKACNVKEGYDYIDFLPDTFFANEQDEGYFIIPNVNYCRLVRFSECGKEGHYESDRFSTRLFGFLKNGIGYVGFVTGMRHEYKLVCGKKDGKYYYFLRFPLEKRAPYEDISMVIHTLNGEDADYNGMAVWYRAYGLKNGYWDSLINKQKERESLKYAAESIYVRIRMGWKPAPPEVLEQTRDTEPEMQVACTFAMVEDLIDEMKSQGIEKAEICLVGWNVKGHDGRWPEMFPVEQSLGGEEGLKHLIKKADDAGYMLGVHTNFTDAYSIAEGFSSDYIIKTPDGNLEVEPWGWSGGRMYHVALPYRENDYIKDLKKIREIGIKGIHYSDVMSIVPPRRSYDEKFPMTPKDFSESCDRTFLAMQQIFDGSASEGGTEHNIKYLDYALYPQMNPNKYNEDEEWMGENIPLWAIIFHGILLYNSTTETVNYGLKSLDKKITQMLYGARPVGYCFVDFMSNNAIWGKEDLRWRENEKPTEVAKEIAKMYHEYIDELKDLQTVFISRHDFLEGGRSRVTYEDGTKIIVDYNTNKYEIIKN